MLKDNIKITVTCVRKRFVVGMQAGSIALDGKSFPGCAEVKGVLTYCAFRGLVPLHKNFN